MSESRTVPVIVGVSAVVISGLLIFACVAILQVRDAVTSTNALAEQIHAAMGRNNELAESTNTHLIEIAAHTADHGWEYDVVSVPDVEWNTTGRQLGKEGWEIVSARRATGSDGEYLYECIVRRPARDTQGAEAPGAADKEREIERVTAELSKAEAAIAEASSDAERVRAQKRRDELEAELLRLKSKG